MEEIKFITDNYVCLGCKHFWGEGCDAFPDGIPDEIMHGLNSHDEPLPNQGNSIVFESIDTLD
jgi:hypothetical protein